MHNKPQLWKRIFAVILDLLLISIPFSVVITSLKFGVSSMAGQIFFFILEILYFSLLTYYWNGQTVGKKLLSLKVISQDHRLSLQQSFMRFFIRDGLVSGIPTLLTIIISPGLTNLISFVVVVWFVYGMYKDLKQQGFHDKLVKTLVVSTK